MSYQDHQRTTIGTQDLQANFHQMRADALMLMLGQNRHGRQPHASVCFMGSLQDDGCKEIVPHNLSAQYSDQGKPVGVKLDSKGSI